MQNDLSSLLRGALLFALLTCLGVFVLSGFLESPPYDLRADANRVAGEVCRDHVRRVAPGVVRAFRPEARDRVVTLDQRRFQVETAFAATPLFHNQRTRVVCIVENVEAGSWRVVNLNLTPGVNP